MKYSINITETILVTMLVIFSLNSCYVPGQTGIPISRQEENIYYIPSTPVSTTLLEKNDINFNLLRSSSEKFTALEFQGAYLPTKKIGIITAYTNALNKDGKQKYMNFNRFELGAGYLKSLPNNWRFETYAGGGFGRVENYHVTGTSQSNLGIFFFQPAFGVTSKNKLVSFDMISKFSGIKFNVKDSAFDTYQEIHSGYQLASLYTTPFNLMWEPALIFKAGWQNFLFHLSYTNSVNFSNRNLYQSKGNIALGISFRFNTAEKTTSSDVIE